MFFLLIFASKTFVACLFYGRNQDILLITISEYRICFSSIPFWHSSVVDVMLTLWLKFVNIAYLINNHQNLFNWLTLIAVSVIGIT